MTATPRILVVDDDADMCDTLGDVLGRRGYDVAMAQRATAGLELLASAPTDAAVLDIMLPDMTGLDLLAAIKDRSPETEVIFITGHASLPTALEAINGTAFAYLIKPFETDDLLSVLQRAVERQQLFRALRETNETLRAVVETAPLAVWVLDRGGALQMWNSTAERTFGWHRDEVLGRLLPIVPPAKRDEFEALLARGFGGQSLEGVEVRRQRRDGIPVDVSLWTAPLRDATGAVVGLVSIAADVTERKRLEAQVQQAQKLDAIGGLAGGIAHDFNNLLTVILGRAQILAGHLEAGHPLRREAELISHTAERAAGLTRQLLAFSRKQVLEPRVLDLAESVRGVQRILQRLIGEDVELVTASERDLGLVRADASQIEQVIMNLAVNARDAMPGGGRLTIETRNVELDEAHARAHPGVAPGSHVMLAVSDTGSGMGPEILAEIFQPFFTTKEPGKGTGLGLSTVYGIVRQSGGHVAVKSDVGRGSSFEIFLPRVGGAADPVPAAPPWTAGGTETVLLVEDDDGLRALAREALSQRGYLVLEAGHPDAAIPIAEQYAEPIHLLLSDLVMPGMNGRALASALVDRRPGLKVLFMSGYPAGLIGTRGVLDAGVSFLPKPFTPIGLARKVRETLDQPPPPGIREAAPGAPPA